VVDLRINPSYRTELMLIDELLEIRLCDQLRRWVPDKFAAELKPAHAFILLSFRAKSRNPVGKSVVSGGEILRLRSE